MLSGPFKCGPFRTPARFQTDPYRAEAYCEALRHAGDHVTISGAFQCHGETITPGTPLTHMTLAHGHMTGAIQQKAYLDILLLLVLATGKKIDWRVGQVGFFASPTAIYLTEFQTLSGR